MKPTIFLTLFVMTIAIPAKTVIAMFSNYNEPTTTRMALGFFHIAIPAIEAAIK